jgi:hypothetical protein
MSKKAGPGPQRFLCYQLQALKQDPSPQNNLILAAPMRRKTDLL